MEENILTTRNLTKNYGNSCVVNNVNMNIKKGDIYGLIGKNGAGKTTIIKTVLSLIEPSSGEIEVFGEIKKCGVVDQNSRIGGIVETPMFYPYLSAKENLEYYRIQRGIPGKECVDESLKLVGLNNVGNKKFKKFSLGMKQRLGMALAIMGNPDFIILDEPINGLDPSGIKEVREILLRLNRVKNITILISSHILGELSQLANCYGFIHEGRLIEEVTAEQLSQKCKQGICLKVDSVEKAAACIENGLKSMDYEVLDDKYIKIYSNLDEPHIINKCLVDNGVMVYSLEKVGINLEEYFLKLVGGNKDA